MKSHFLPGLIGVAALCLSGPRAVGAESQPAASHPPTEEVRRAIDEAKRTFLTAALARDTARLEALLAPEFVYVHENGAISTKESFLRDYLSLGYVSVADQFSEPIRQYGNAVITISTGHLQLSTETPHPQTSVTQVWLEQNGRWLLAHRQESHRGEPIGRQLPPEGGPNPARQLGARPAPVLEKIINERTASWIYCMLTADDTRMDPLIDESLRYVHVTAHTSSKMNFMDELRSGYSETFFQDTTLRHYGDIVLAQHRARYRHTGKAEQSPSIALHVWFKKAGQWVLVSRHATRFAAY
jgi:hypothetical protein